MKFSERFSRLMKSESGMSLIEIMVVLTIIAMITGLAIYYVGGYMAEARVETTKVTIRNVEDALEQFKRRHGFYPSTEQGLQALVEKPTSGERIPEDYPPDGYLRNLPKDGWKNDFIYRYPGTSGHKLEIISLGADNEEGGEGEDADITNYDQARQQQ